MRIVVIADTHIHSFTRFGIGVGAQNSRFQICLDALEQVKQFCLQQKIKHIIHAGDLFHARDHQRFGIFNATYDKLQEIREAGIQIDILAGNHDIIDRAGTTSLHTLRSDGIRIHNKPGFSHTIIDAPPFFMIPFTTDYSAVADAMSSVSPNTIVIGHLDVAGAQPGSTPFVMEKGINYKQVFGRQKLVLFGHYHKHQKLGDNGYYIGSLCPIDFGEADQYGQFAVIDTDEPGNVTFYRIEAPRFINVDPSTYKTKEVAGNYIRIHSAVQPEIEEYLERAGALGWEWKPPLTELQSETRIESVGTKTPTELVVDYVNQRKPTALDHGRLVTIGQELLGEQK